jgi:hypothetical protein
MRLLANDNRLEKLHQSVISEKLGPGNGYSFFLESRDLSPVKRELDDEDT